ncbi:MAG: alpha/beta hydrolase [Alphaproteobacteria bacterium]
MSVSQAGDKAATEHLIDFRGGKLWAQSGNLDADGPVRVFVHGNSAPGSVWLSETVKQYQDAGKPYVVFDLPGHGKSSAYDEYGINTMVGALSAVITDLKLDQREEGYAGIGWSYGGNILMQAMEQKKLPGLAGLALVGTPPMNMDKREGLPSEFRASEAESFAYDPVIKEAYFLTAELTSEQYKAMAKAFVCHSDNEGCGVPEALQQTLFETDPNVRGDLLKSLLAGDIKDEINILANREGVPLIMIFGEKDAVAGISYVKTIGPLIAPEHLTILPDTGHAVLTEKPAEAMNTLESALKEIIKPSSPESAPEQSGLERSGGPAKLVGVNP